ncbi:MAG TPA: SDR family NAD(P)-dependent oxidoreductase [Polyangiaceae bacterium]|nr:SDR family NAD(P)-dependent oxidoreductase [Polyangiaceae bacterium]
MHFRSRWVLVTGASSGLGREIARSLATEHGANLVLVARREERLRELEAELEAKANVDVVTICADLSNLEHVERVYHEATQGRQIYGVVLNAGVTHFGQHHELSWPDFQKMLNTNVTGVVRLTSLFLPHLEQQAAGCGILLVSSMAGLTPVPYQTAYSATKAFLLNYGRCLYHELNGQGVSVTTFVPGGIFTEMTQGERFVPLRGWLMPVDRCAREAVRAFQNRSYMHLPGLSMRLGTWLMRFLPQRFLTSRVAATYRGALQAHAAKSPPASPTPGGTSATSPSSAGSTPASPTPASPTPGGTTATSSTSASST